MCVCVVCVCVCVCVCCFRGLFLAAVLFNNIWNTNYPDWLPFDGVGIFHKQIDICLRSPDSVSRIFY